MTFSLYNFFTRDRCHWILAIIILVPILTSTAGWAMDLEGCELYPAGYYVTEDWSNCLNQLPWTRITGRYGCVECGITGGIKSVTKTGYGECGCYPEALEPIYSQTTITVAVEKLHRDEILPICHQDQPYSKTGACSCPPCDDTPIIISLVGNSLQLTDASGGVAFDLNADGVPSQTAWTEAGADDAFLVLDRDGNGVIDDGSELFGSRTPQPVADFSERNGFEALAAYDDALNGGNEDGFIDELDSVFGQLALWADLNHDGYSDALEIVAIADSVVRRISLNYRETSRVDSSGNRFRFASIVDTGRGRRTAWDVYLAQAEGSGSERSEAEPRSCW